MAKTEKAPAVEKKRDVVLQDRRLASGSAFARGSRSMPLKEPHRWTTRDVNRDISDDHIFVMQTDLGWVYAQASDFAVDPIIFGWHAEDGRLVKGQRGQIVLMKKPLADYQAIMAMKDAENRIQTFSPKANKAAIVANAEREPDGDQAADLLQRSVQSLEVKDWRGAAPSED
jgi:hypothetical protein